MAKTQINGGIIKDANKELYLTITKADVKAGATKNSSSCAAARALMRQEGCTEAKVHLNRTYIKKGNEWLRFKTPPALRSEVVAFDRGGTFEPGDYKLVPIPPSDRNRGRQKRADRTDKNAGRGKKRVKASNEKAKQHITTGVRQRFAIGGRLV